MLSYASIFSPNSFLPLKKKPRHDRLRPFFYPGRAMVFHYIPSKNRSSQRHDPRKSLKGFIDALDTAPSVCRRRTSFSHSMESILQWQRKCEDALHSLLVLGARRPVRRLASMAMGKVIAKGDGISIYSRASSLQGWLADRKRSEPHSCAVCLQGTCKGRWTCGRGRPIINNEAWLNTKEKAHTCCVISGRVRVAVRIRPRNAQEMEADFVLADCVELLPEIKTPQKELGFRNL